jgi:hypothetical protein
MRPSVTRSRRRSTRSNGLRAIVAASTRAVVSALALQGIVGDQHGFVGGLAKRLERRLRRPALSHRCGPATTSGGRALGAAVDCEHTLTREVLR